MSPARETASSRRSFLSLLAATTVAAPAAAVAKPSPALVEPSLPELWKQYKAAKAEFLMIGRLLAEADDVSPDQPYPPSLDRADKAAGSELTRIEEPIERARARTVEDVEIKLLWLVELKEFEPPDGFVESLATDVGEILRRPSTPHFGRAIRR